MASAVQTAVQVQMALSSIGSPPVESSTVKGEETDKLVTGFGNVWLISAALIAIASAGTFGIVFCVLPIWWLIVDTVDAAATHQNFSLRTIAHCHFFPWH